MKIENAIYNILKAVTHQEINQFKDSLWLTGRVGIGDEGSCAVFKHIPSHFVDKPGNIQHIANNYGAALYWEENFYWFSGGKAWKNGKQIENEEEAKKVFEEWKEYIEEREKQITFELE